MSSACRSPQRRARDHRRAAPRHGPARGLDAFAVGLDRVRRRHRRRAAHGRGRRRGRSRRSAASTAPARRSSPAGSPSARKAAGFATAEVQISETETPLHRLETVYRRCRAAVDGRRAAGRAADRPRALVLRARGGRAGRPATSASATTAALAARVDELMERRLAEVSRSARRSRPRCARTARRWPPGTRHRPTGSSPGSAGSRTSPPRSSGPPASRATSTTSGALRFLQGLLVVLRDAGHAGLVLVLDEVETLQRVRSDVREKALNALRQLIDEIDAGRFPGLYLVITGTPAFFDGPQGVAAPRAARPAAARPTSTATRGSTTRAPCSSGCRRSTSTALVEVGTRVRDLYAEGRDNAERICARCRRRLRRALADAVAGRARRPGRDRAADLPARSSSATCSTGSTSSPTSTPAATTRSTVGDGELTLEERESRVPRADGRRHRPRLV